MSKNEHGYFLRTSRAPSEIGEFTRRETEDAQAEPAGERCRPSRDEQDGATRQGCPPISQDGPQTLAHTLRVFGCNVDAGSSFRHHRGKKTAVAVGRVRSR